MDYQTLLNIAFSAAGALGMWIINSLKDSINALHKSDIAISEKVQKIELLVTGVYVKRDELDRMTSALFAKLDKIELKIDGKADKSAYDPSHFKGPHHD
jgi:CRISPR/Cas system type I-B associated protein Csh2 (Cas7 group RAMP superfamily)